MPKTFGEIIIDIIYKICTIYNMQPNELLSMNVINSEARSNNNFKGEVIKKLIELNQKIESTNYDELKKIISTISIREHGVEFEIEYQKEEISISKITEKSTIAMVSILTQFISQILNQMKIIIEKEKFDEDLIRCYIGYKDIVNEYF